MTVIEMMETLADLDRIEDRIELLEIHDAIVLVEAEGLIGRYDDGVLGTGFNGLETSDMDDYEYQQMQSW